MPMTDGNIDRLYLVGNEFVNTMTQQPQVEQLLPLLAEDSDETEASLGLYLRARCQGAS